MPDESAMIAVKRILLVDDDAELRMGASARLRAAGYEICTATNGREGLQAAVAHHPDVILMDVRLPEIDGLEALAELKRRKETQDIPVVMLSASIHARQAALDHGAKYFISKPYDGSTLLAAVESVTTAP